MNTPVLNDNLRSATEALCNLLAKEDKVVASKAKIGLFFQNPEATKLFEEVNAYGEELRNKHLAGMPPTEEKFPNLTPCVKTSSRMMRPAAFWKRARPLTNS
ncbi:MAG: hypothetical protein ACLT38_03740 [Akkermansia sp.]